MEGNIFFELSSDYFISFKLTYDLLIIDFHLLFKFSITRIKFIKREFHYPFFSEIKIVLISLIMTNIIVNPC